MQHSAIHSIRMHRNGVERDDLVAVEEPMEVRIGDLPWMVTMRTPGHDDELAAGLLWSEGVVRDPAEIIDIRHCSAQDLHAAGNVIIATVSESAAARAVAMQRGRPAFASCGVCGKQNIESLACELDPIVDTAHITADVLRQLPSQLSAAQAAFARTGGLHAAGLFSIKGNCECVREDIGRHNAVDKIVGWAVLEQRAPLANHALIVSGRVSFEIVQKAWTAGIPIVAAISAPSSLAISLAYRAGITLIGFLRPDSMNVYAHDRRTRQS